MCNRVLPLTREWIEIATAFQAAFLWHVLPLTREWIEIPRLQRLRMLLPVLPLTREWIEIRQDEKLNVATEGSPSYEGVDWNLARARKKLDIGQVLPLTREWIEILLTRSRFLSCLVLPLTREWIEINHVKVNAMVIRRSPSYEGVDWNHQWRYSMLVRSIVLPLTREWIEIAVISKTVHRNFGFYLLRGSGLKWLHNGYQKQRQGGSPSYEGVDWNFLLDFSLMYFLSVLPLTREWIEISLLTYLIQACQVLPLTREWIEI